MRTTYCTLHGPGHSPQYIQARQITDFLRHYPERCHRVTVTDLGAGWFSMDIDGDTRLGWNHDHDLVTAIARDSVLREVIYTPDFEALVRRVGQAGTILIPAWGEARRCVPLGGRRVVVDGPTDDAA
ncbi:hypothetical protein [Corynebacterium terpenotabidum]|uniref:Uncharacterized protein n=1 Tax=Corynebacterium terpenotabidum Y-11 TaxID=1200352 RepID=S4XHD6_9CORY|nr:hypothetical protein [Corynebacterium terpenotabidum]AGP30058.1 hypothetical protein A606_02015 [Corynebacterium terpenotabidum Y-11]